MFRSVMHGDVPCWILAAVHMSTDNAATPAQVENNNSLGNILQHHALSACLMLQGLYHPGTYPKPYSPLLHFFWLNQPRLFTLSGHHRGGCSNGTAPTRPPYPESE